MSWTGSSFFIAVVDQLPDQTYSVTYPDLAACKTTAASRDLIVSAGQKALALWFAENSYVWPSPLHTVRRMDAVQAAIDKGATLVAIRYQAPVSCAA